MTIRTIQSLLFHLMSVYNVCLYFPGKFSINFVFRFIENNKIVFSILILSPWASLVAQLVKIPASMWETWVWSLGWEDPLEEGGHGTPLQCSCLENPMDRGAWRAAVPGVAESWTRLSESAQHYLLISVVAAFLFYSIYACLLSHSRSGLFLSRSILQKIFVPCCYCC